MEYRLRDRDKHEMLNRLSDIRSFSECLQEVCQGAIEIKPKKLYIIAFGRGDDGEPLFKAAIRGEQIVCDEFSATRWNDLSSSSPRPDPTMIYQLEIERDGKTHCFAATWNQHTRAWKTASGHLLISTVGADRISFKPWRTTK